MTSDPRGPAGEPMLPPEATSEPVRDAEIQLATESVPGDPRTSSLAGKALSGVAWNLGGAVILILAQIASTAATARLVAPEEFGAYAAAQAAAGFLGYFTMTAVGPGLQRRPQLGANTVGTALAISLVGSGIVTAALWLGASPWADAWGIPDATSTVRALAVAMLVMSISVVPLALLSRRLEFAKVAVIETGSLVLGLGSGVALATQLHSALALALGQLIAAFTLLTITGGIVRRELRLSFNRADARELFTFASQVGGLGFFTYFINMLPNLFVARTFGASVLGLYSRANLVVALPAEYALRSIFKVVYPIYGRIREDLARTKVLLGETLTLTTGLVWPLFGLIAGASPVVVAVLLGERWHDAAPYLSLFGLIVCAWIPCGLLTNAAEAFGWMRVIALRQLALFFGIASTLVIVYLAHLSLIWLLVGVALAEWGVYVLTLRPYLRRGYLDGRSVLREQAVHAALAVAACGAAAACARVLEGAALLAQVAAQFGVGAAVMGTIVHGRRWIPATRILASRVGATSAQGIARAGWAALR